MPNKDILGRYLEIVSSGNWSALDDVLAKNYLRYVSTSPAPLDLDHQKQRLAGMRAVFPDLVVTPDKLIAEGDFVALHATVRGTQRGNFLNIEATGRSVAVPAFEIIRFENGKMVEHWGGMDLFLLTQQLKGSG
jgi:predicted ester cyclase